MKQRFFSAGLRLFVGISLIPCLMAIAQEPRPKTGVRAYRYPLALQMLKSRTKPIRIDFKHVDTAENVREAVKRALAKQPESPKFSMSSIVAQPLTKENLNLLSRLMGKRLNISELKKLNLSYEKLNGLFFTALNLDSLNKAEEDYRTSYNAATNTAARTSLTREWQQFRASFVGMLNSRGLQNVTEAAINTWRTDLKVSMLNTQLQSIMAEAKPSTMTIEDSIGFRIAPSQIATPAEPTESSSSSDLCSQPLASGSYGYSYNVSYDWTVDIPYWCPTWRHPTRWCHKEVTLFTFELCLDFSVGYEITCTGGSAWVSGEGSMTIDGITLACGASGTAVIGAGSAGSDQSTCVYGFGIDVYIGCDICGISFGYDYPLAGFEISAPCPGPISHIGSVREAVYAVLQTRVGSIDMTPVVVQNLYYQAYEAYFAYVGYGVDKYGLPDTLVAALTPYYGESLLREVSIGVSHRTSSDDNAMTDCKTMYFPSEEEADLVKTGKILDKYADGSFVYAGGLHWLLHELQHTHQCADVGGRRKYAINWFSQLESTMLEELVTDPSSVSGKTIHNRMPMEAQADAKADEVMTKLR